MNNDINQVVRRTRQYWFSDGIVELSIGGLFIILGIYFYLQSLLAPGSLALIALQIGFVFVLIGLIFISRFLINKIKTRLTTPRTGFVSYKPATKKQRIISLGIVILIALTNVILFLSTPLSMNWIPAITGLIVGTLWLISAFRVSLTRFHLQAILAFLLGGTLSLANLDLYQALALFYGILGATLTLSGGITLARYLRHNPPFEEEFQAG